MNQDDIIRMAREACPYTTDEMRGAFYEGFLKGAVAERKKCVDILMRLHERSAGSHNYYHFAANQIAGESVAREHRSSGDCWCNPELNYVHPVTGVEVWVHKEPQ